MVKYSDLKRLFGRKRTSNIPMNLGIERERTDGGRAVLRVRHTMCDLPENHVDHADNPRRRLIMATTFANDKRKSNSCRPVEAEITQEPCHTTKKMKRAVRAYCSELRDENGNNVIGDSLFADFCLRCRRHQPSDPEAVGLEVNYI